MQSAKKQRKMLEEDFKRAGASTRYPNRWAHYPFLRDQLMHETDLKGGQEVSILDIGCGPGTFPHFCIERKGLKWFGIELWGYQLQQAFDKGPYAGLVQGNLVKTLPFRSQTFDVVVCNEVLMYLPDPDVRLSEFLRVLKPGGLLTIYEPISFFPYIKSRLKLFSRKLFRNKDGAQFDLSDNQWRVATRPLRITYHSVHTLTERVQNNGFKIEGVAGFRLFRNRFSPIKRLENHYLFFRLNSQIARRFPSLATDLMVLARRG
jgi:SAM-dependent methyltransferase